jgi:talin
MIVYIFITWQALDSNFTEENRQKCAEAAKPLVNAVDELTTFASSPEFASKQAKISPKVITCVT